MTYHIISTPRGYHIAETGLDQFLVLLHSRPMDSSEAAERLRDDLTNERCPFPLTTPTDAHDPGEHVARCYDVAARIVPHLPKGKDAWAVALRIADAGPWFGPRHRPAHRPVHGADFDSDQIPF